MWVGWRRICGLGWCRKCGLDGGGPAGWNDVGSVGWDGVGQVGWVVQDVEVGWKRTCGLGQPCCCSSGSEQLINTALGAPMLCCDLSGPGALSCSCCPQATTQRLGLAMCPQEELCPSPQDQEDCPRALLVRSRSLQTVAEFPLPSGTTGPGHCLTPLIFSVTERSYFWAGKVKVRASRGRRVDNFKAQL